MPVHFHSVPSFSHSSLTRSSSPLLLRALIENVKKGSFSAANAEINGLLLEKSSRNLKARKCRGKRDERKSSPADCGRDCLNAEEGESEEQCEDCSDQTADEAG